MGRHLPSCISPVILRSFRVAVGLQLGVLVVMSLARPQMLVYAPEGLALLGFLYWPGLAVRLDRLFVPAGIALACGLTILTHHLTSPTMVSEPEPGLVAALVVPAVIAGMQYGARGVNVVVAAAAMVDGLLYLAHAHLGTGLSGAIMAVVPRAAVLAMAGYIAAYLVSVGQERRRALIQQNVHLARHAAVVEQLATAAERNRVARELHDTLAHTLSGLVIQLEAVRSVWATNPDLSRELLDRALATTRSGLTDARRALQDLRSSPLEERGLSGALRQMAESVAARTGAALTLQTPESSARFAPELEQSFYRVAQEALENVASHARATAITVALERIGSSLRLTVADNGRGFDAAALNGDGHLGITGMRERAELLGGAVELASRPGGPTTVRLIVPIPS